MSDNAARTAVVLMAYGTPRTPEEIEKVMRWSQADSFWRCNILSAAKLCDKFDQLTLKMKNGHSGQNQARDSRAPRGPKANPGKWGDK